VRTIEGSRRTHLLPVSAGLIGWRSTLWCEEASHGGEGADGYHHDDAAINHDHGAEFGHFGEARDTAEITRDERPVRSLRPRVLQDYAPGY
jgi:hypothetical protein